MSKLKIGLLETGYRDDLDSLSIVNEVIEYCINAEKLGFSRFWLTEHHNTYKNHPWTNPDILVNTLAGFTETIRIGAAGVLLPFYNSYSVATNYKFINNLFNNRIDLGLAKTLIESKFVMNSIDPSLDKSNMSLKFDKKMYELWDFFKNEKPNYMEKGVVIPPYGGDVPSVWYLSNTYNSSHKAIECGFNFCRSIFHGTYGTEVKPYKSELENFRSKFLEKNKVNPEVAIALALHLDSTVEEAKKSLEKSIEKEDSGTPWGIIPTSINKLRDLLLEYQYNFGVDEFIIYDVAADSIKRNENINQISEVFNLV